MPDINTKAEHILVVEENTEGHDIMVGDIHGEISLLKNLVSKLRPQDRLFILGDLTDRGEDSLAVLEFIREHNNAHNAPKIFSIRGNHEDLLLRYISTRLNPELFTEEQIEKIGDAYIENGGDWAMNLSDEKLKEIKEQIEALPYVIHGKGRNPFILAHADFNFTDKELQERIASGNLTLTAEQIRYITWARQPNAKINIAINNPRTWDSIVVYVGHSVLDGVRRATNHINLDFGSCFNGHLGIVNHSTRRCVAHTTALSVDDKVKEIIKDINHQLRLQTRPLTDTIELEDNIKYQKGIIKPVTFSSLLRPLMKDIRSTKIACNELIAEFEKIVISTAKSITEKAGRIDDRYSDKFQDLEFKRILQAVGDHLLVLQDIHDMNIIISESMDNDVIPQAHREEYFQNAQRMFTCSIDAMLPLFLREDFDSRGNLNFCGRMHDLVDAINQYLDNPFDHRNIPVLDEAKEFLNAPELAAIPFFQDLLESVERTIRFSDVMAITPILYPEVKKEPEEEKENTDSKVILSTSSNSIFKIRQLMEDEDNVKMIDVTPKKTT